MKTNIAVDVGLAAHITTRTRNIAIAVLMTLTFVAGAVPVNAWSQSRPTLSDVGFAAVKRLGQLPLLTIRTDYSNEKFDVDNRWSTYQKLLYGQSNAIVPNIAGKRGFFEQNSNGLFRFRNVGIIGPLTFKDLPGTPDLNESTYNCLLLGRDGCQPDQNLPGYNIPNSFSRVIEMADEHGVKLEEHDKNRDGVVTNQELSVLWIEANAYGYNSRTDTNSRWSRYTTSTKIGYVYTDAAPDTKPLYEWFSVFRLDTLLTSDSKFDPANNSPVAIAARKSYEFRRIIGHVKKKSKFGSQCV